MRRNATRSHCILTPGFYHNGWSWPFCSCPSVVYGKVENNLLFMESVIRNKLYACFEIQHFYEIVIIHRHMNVMKKNNFGKIWRASLNSLVHGFEYISGNMILCYGNNVYLNNKHKFTKPTKAFLHGLWNLLDYPWFDSRFNQTFFVQCSTW